MRYDVEMNLDDVTPPHCHARATHLLAEIALVREAMGRTADPRPLLAITGAEPRACFVTTTSLWEKANRLSDEVDAEATTMVPPMPGLGDIRPGHVVTMIDAVIERVAAIKTQLGLTTGAGAPAPDASKTPSDVLAVIVQCCRELSRCMERPFAPRDCYRQVELASAYAMRLPALRERSAGSAARPAPFVANQRPASCFASLQACLRKLGPLVGKTGHTAVALTAAPTDIVPGDVYDLATIVLGEIAFLHTATAGAAPLYAFTPTHDGHRLPAHVDQAAQTLLAQLGALG